MLLSILPILNAVIPIAVTLIVMNWALKHPADNRATPPFGGRF